MNVNVIAYTVLSPLSPPVRHFTPLLLVRVARASRACPVSVLWLSSPPLVSTCARLVREPVMPLSTAGPGATRRLASSYGCALLRVRVVVVAHPLACHHACPPPVVRTRPPGGTLHPTAQWYSAMRTQRDPSTYIITKHIHGIAATCNIVTADGMIAPSERSHGRHRDMRCTVCTPPLKWRPRRPRCSPHSTRRSLQWTRRLCAACSASP